MCGPQSILKYGQKTITREDWKQECTCNHDLYRTVLQKVGCDWQVDSEAEEDKCGVCHGDGKLCSTQKGYYNNTDGDGECTSLLNMIWQFNSF